MLRKSSRAVSSCLAKLAHLDLHSNLYFRQRAKIVSIAHEQASESHPCLLWRSSRNGSSGGLRHAERRPRTCLVA